MLACTSVGEVVKNTPLFSDSFDSLELRDPADVMARVRGGSCRSELCPVLSCDRDSLASRGCARSDDVTVLPVAYARVYPGGGT